MHLSVLFFVYRLKTFWNAFGLLCASKSVAQVMLTLVFLGWSAPLAIKQSTLGSPSKANIWMGRAQQLLDFVTLLSDAAIAVNRFCAISFPSRYRHFSGKHLLSGFVGLLWVLAMLVVFLFAMNRGDVFFDAQVLIWQAVYSESLVSFINQIGFDMSLTVGVILIDMATFISVVLYKMVKSNLPFVSQPSSPSKQVPRHKVSTKSSVFFAQIAVQNVLGLLNVVLIYTCTTGDSFIIFFMNFALWIIIINTDA
ncbi:hypothetical protein L596_014012 [Steinernema carpocapsae]|uniref:7TM GPCR serpentine receptor class x (Srx) domain-containing protein n=1 Tax=Steinernema carpocapsae TaxID=34508 RepID=A0A4U5NBK9_STECR|nr:hypothetical protein L596_014012 [Steinernema carpocapsae]